MNSIIDSCEFNLFRGHKFEARYDKSKADFSGFKSIERATSDLCESLRTITYVKDVCVRCGK